MINDINQREIESIPREWLGEFEAAARRPLKTRMKYAFIKTYKPVLDDSNFALFRGHEISEKSVVN